MALANTQPTVYSTEPRIFFLRDSTSFQPATDPLELALVDLRKGTCVVDAWVDITVSIGGAGGAGTLFHRDATPTDVEIIAVADLTALIRTDGPVKATGYDPIASDGAIWFKKTGAGTALVFSVMCMMLRPNMNP